MQMPKFLTPTWQSSISDSCSCSSWNLPFRLYQALCFPRSQLLWMKLFRFVFKGLPLSCYNIKNTMCSFPLTPFERGGATGNDWHRRYKYYSKLYVLNGLWEKIRCLTKIYQKITGGLSGWEVGFLPSFGFKAHKNFIQSSGQSLLHPNLCKSTLFCSVLSLLISSAELYPSQYCYTHCIFMLLLLSGLFCIFALSCIQLLTAWSIE